MPIELYRIYTNADYNETLGIGACSTYCPDLGQHYYSVYSKYITINDEDFGDCVIEDPGAIENGLADITSLAISNALAMANTIRSYGENCRFLIYIEHKYLSIAIDNTYKSDIIYMPVKCRSIDQRRNPRIYNHFCSEYRDVDKLMERLKEALYPGLLPPPVTNEEDEKNKKEEKKEKRYINKRLMKIKN